MTQQRLSVRVWTSHHVSTQPRRKVHSSTGWLSCQARKAPGPSFPRDETSSQNAPETSLAYPNTCVFQSVLILLNHRPEPKPTHVNHPSTHMYVSLRIGRSSCTHLNAVVLSRRSRGRLRQQQTSTTASSAGQEGSARPPSVACEPPDRKRGAPGPRVPADHGSARGAAGVRCGADVDENAVGINIRTHGGGACRAHALDRDVTEDVHGVRILGSNGGQLPSQLRDARGKCPHLAFQRGDAYLARLRDRRRKRSVRMLGRTGNKVWDGAVTICLFRPLSGCRALSTTRMCIGTDNFREKRKSLRMH